MAKIIKPVYHEQKLPVNASDKLREITDKETRAAYIAVLRMQRWTLQSIASACGLTRERVRQLQAEARPSKVLSILGMPNQFPVPEIPTKEVEVKDSPVYIEPSSQALSRLLELQPLAQQVRYDHPQYRKEAEEYTSLLNYVHTVEKVTLYRLAKRLGVTHGALRFRLARYGYIKHAGKSSCYTPIKEKNRV